MAFSQQRANELRKRIAALGAPSAILDRFDQLLAESVFAHDNSDDLESLLRDACRISNWTTPWAQDGQELSFRAKRLDQSCQDFHEDCQENNTPATEQAYRRGFSQGFNAALSNLEIDPTKSDQLLALARKIDQWRSEEIYEVGITGVNISSIELRRGLMTLPSRSGVPPKKRFEVLSRDNHRCRSCGVTPQEGAVLEVDHINSVQNGGDDDIENLQTLCRTCNRGKGGTSA